MPDDSNRREDVAKLADEIREVVIYDPETGQFFWRNGFSRSGSRLISQDRNYNGKGYNRIKVLGRRYRTARLAFLIMEGRFPEEVDHRDGDASNDAWANLREATRAENNQNRRSPRREGLKGANKCRSKWQSSIIVEGKNIYLGTFATPEAAHAAYCDAAAKYHREFARVS